MSNTMQLIGELQCSELETLLVVLMLDEWRRTKNPHLIDYIVSRVGCPPTLEPVVQSVARGRIFGFVSKGTPGQARRFAEKFAMLHLVAYEIESGKTLDQAAEAVAAIFDNKEFETIRQAWWRSGQKEGMRATVRSLR
jgi:hypothetical protein